MTRRAIKDYKPFRFSHDFAGGIETDETRIPVSADELARLLAEARVEGMVAANQEFETGLADDMQNAASSLNLALADLVALAGHLEALGPEPAMSETARTLINTAAQRIIDGQGDLFHVSGQDTEPG